MSINTEIRIDGAIKKLHYNIKEWEEDKVRDIEDIKHLYLLYAALCLRTRWTTGLLRPLDIKKDDSLALKMLKGCGLKRTEEKEGYYSFS